MFNRFRAPTLRWARFIQLHMFGTVGGVSLQPAILANLHEAYPLDSLAAVFWPTRYGSGWGVFEEFGGTGLAHDGSNGSWYCSAVVYPDEGFALIAVTNIGGGPNGNGDAAVGEVIQMLKKRQVGVPRFSF